MGNKLGKMVISLKNQIVLFIMFSLLQISFLDAQDIANKKIYKPIIKENEIGKIYSFAGSPDKFVLKKVVKGFPKKRTLTKLRFADENDTYVIKVFGDDKKKFFFFLGGGKIFF